MTPKMSPTFESRVRIRLANLLSDVGAQIVVDSVSVETSPNSSGESLLVDFHLEGAWSSPAGFTFPFHESVSLDHSLAAMRDMISKSWQRAHLAPPVAGPRSAVAFD